MELYPRHLKALGSGRQVKMERLDDIISRSMPEAQRRRRTIEKGSQAGTTRGPRADQLPPPQNAPGEAPPRRPRHPLPEQMADLGQQTLPARQTYNQRGQSSPPLRTPSTQGESPRLQASLKGPDLQAPVEADTRPTYPQRPRSLREPQYPSTNDYYQADAYASMTQADVAEDWEDDAVAMRYGDWESDEQEMQMYVRPPVEAAPRSNRSPITRELSPVPGSEARPYLARTPRDLPVSSSLLPSPQMPVQEIQHHRRTTQPLDPYSILHMSQEISQEAPPATRPTRQIIVREQVAFHASTAPVTPPNVCPVCKGAGYLRADVPFGHPNFGKPIACECKEAEWKEKRRQQLRSISNLDAFQDKTFKTFNHTVSGPVQRAYQVAYEYAKEPDGWLVFIGKNGCGKTHLAAAIANRCLARGSLVLFCTVIELLDHLRATFVPTSTEVYDQLFAKMREAELLVLDDLGAQQSSPWANEKLFQLLNYRYNSRIPTIITTNNIGLQAIDERIRSRLVDASLVITVTFDGAYDYRPHNPRR